LKEAFRRDGEMRLRKKRRGGECYRREGKEDGEMRGGRGGFTQMRIYGDAKSGSQTFFIYNGGDNSLLNNGCHL
jgi:hypothetical protein